MEDFGLELSLETVDTGFITFGLYIDDEYIEFKGAFD